MDKKMSEDNIDDDVQILEDLKSSEARFYNVVDISPDGIVVIDRAGIIRFINYAAQTLFGRSEESLLGQEFGFPVVSGHKTEIHIEILSAVRTPITAEMRVVEIVWEKEPAFLASIRDISEHTRLAKELNNANTELSQFSYTVSHDIKAPLRNVESLAAWLIEDYGDKLDARISTDLNLIEENVRRMLRLVDGLLQFTEIGFAETDIKTVELGLIMDEVLENLRADIVESKAAISVGELPSLPGDSILLISLFQNLLSNSIKYCGEPIPAISIDAQRINKGWKISITDNGIGIEEKYWQKIFLPFKRLHANSDYSGSGIGLASCKKIVEQHNGKIWLDSKAGRGSTFHISLPASESQSNKFCA